MARGRYQDSVLQASAGQAFDGTLEDQASQPHSVVDKMSIKIQAIRIGASNSEALYRQLSSNV